MDDPIQQPTALQKFREFDEKADASLRSTAHQASVYLPGGQVIPLAIRATDLTTDTANKLGRIAIGKEPTDIQSKPSAIRTASNVMLATSPVTQIPWVVYHLAQPAIEQRYNAYKVRKNATDEIPHGIKTGGSGSGRPLRFILATIILVIFCLVIVELGKHISVLREQQLSSPY